MIRISIYNDKKQAKYKIKTDNEDEAKFYVGKTIIDLRIYKKGCNVEYKENGTLAIITTENNSITENVVYVYTDKGSMPVADLKKQAIKYACSECERLLSCAIIDFRPLKPSTVQALGQKQMDCHYFKEAKNNESKKQNNSSIMET